MSLTLGEKLRQAREERGIPISEVAEQTRISSLYLQSIENDDYKILPGGIFNKGFIKSYAKYVGIDEQEALLDYSRILAQTETTEPDNLKPYKPEVLTDDNSRSSTVPTVIYAVIILALMSAGVWFGVNYGVSYFRSQPDSPPANSLASNANTSMPSNSNTSEPSGSTPEMATLKVEVKAVGQPVLITATTDGTKADSKVAAGSSVTFEPKESLTINYNRWNFKAVQMSINGKSITLPAEPLDRKGQRIEFTISKATLAQIWQKGAISTEVPAADVDANANTAATPGPSTPPVTKTTPAPKPSVTANTASTPTPGPKPADTPKPTPKPAATKPATNNLL